MTIEAGADKYSIDVTLLGCGELFVDSAVISDETDEVLVFTVRVCKPELGE